MNRTGMGYKMTGVWEHWKIPGGHYYDNENNNDDNDNDNNDNDDNDYNDSENDLSE